MDRLLQRKNIINTGRITPLPVSRNPESKTGNVQEKRDQEGSSGSSERGVSCAARKQTMGEIMAETKGRTKHEGARDERKAESKAR